MSTPGPSTVAQSDLASLASIQMRVAAGAGLGNVSALDPRAARALDVADRIGAPLLPVVEMVQASTRQQQDLDAAMAAAVAPARTVAVALTLLPVVVTPLLASIVGIDLGEFYLSGVGMLVGAAVLALWVVGAAATLGMVKTVGRSRTAPVPRIMLAGAVGWLIGGPIAGALLALVAGVTYRPQAPPPHPDLADLCEILAAALHTGMPAATALREVANDVPTLTRDVNRLALLTELGVGDLPARAPAELQRIACVVGDGRRSGGPLAPAIRSLAGQVRAELGAAARAQAERLPAQLTFPTILCLLPAAVLAIGAPIISSGLSTFSST